MFKKIIYLVVSGVFFSGCGLQFGPQTNSTSNSSNSNPAVVSDSYTVSATIQGMPSSGGQIQISLNGEAPLTFTNSGSFQFPQSLNNGTSYQVTIVQGPNYYTCSVQNGAGSISGQNVNNVQIICGCAQSPMAHNSVGSGTASNPYLIFNSTQILSLAAVNTGGNALGGYYKQVCDIDYQSIPYTMGIAQGVDFIGSYDGSGLQMKNFYMVPSIGQNAGLFTKLGKNSLVQNIVFESPIVKIASPLAISNVGILAGESAGKIKKITFNKPFMDLQGSGLCAGYAAGTIHDEVSNTIIKQGTLNAANVKNVGGVTGCASSFTGVVSGLGYTLVPRILFTQIDDSTLSCAAACGSVMGSDSDHVTLAMATVKNSNVKASSIYVGTLPSAGGIAGLLNGRMMQSYFHGRVEGGASVGGIVGMLVTNPGYGSIQNTFTASDIFGVSNVGRMVGSVSATFAMTQLQNNYFDQSNACGASCSSAYSNGSDPNSTRFKDGTHPLFTAAPQVWDFTNVWTLVPGTYPALRM